MNENDARDAAMRAQNFPFARLGRLGEARPQMVVNGWAYSEEHDAWRKGDSIAESRSDLAQALLAAWSARQSLEVEKERRAILDAFRRLPKIMAEDLLKQLVASL